jgi:hypothetical protein
MSSRTKKVRKTKHLLGQNVRRHTDKKTSGGGQNVRRHNILLAYFYIHIKNFKNNMLLNSFQVCYAINMRKTILSHNNSLKTTSERANLAGDGRVMSGSAMVDDKLLKLSRISPQPQQEQRECMD